MGPYAFLAVGVGAVIGAWLRWWLGVHLNPIVPTLPIGTLTANLLGGLLIGLAIALLERYPQVAPEVQLLFITGFLGALTTFSTFSGEVVGLITRREYLWAAGTVAAHVAGSLLLTGLGIASVMALSNARQ